MNLETTFKNVSFIENQIPKINCLNGNPEISIINNFIEDFGIVLLENFYNIDTILKFINEFDKIISNGEYTTYLENLSGDIRLYNAEKYSPYLFDNISENKYLNNIANYYISNNNSILNIIPNKQILINKLNFNKNSINNSGGNWHRDNNYCQFKLIMYLTDVSDQNGNFQFLTHSNYKKIGFPESLTHNKSECRYNDNIINNIIKNNPKCKIINITGKKGTILLVNTSYIHRGNIIKDGERKALTQYYL